MAAQRPRHAVSRSHKGTFPNTWFLQSPAAQENTFHPLFREKGLVGDKLDIKTEKDFGFRTLDFSVDLCARQIAPP